MIHEVSGDILLTKAQVIAHGVAPGDDFKQGLAAAIRESWPAMVKDFRHWCHNTHPKPGEAWVWGGVGGHKIVNLLTQEPPTAAGQHPGTAKLEHVNHALKALHAMVEQQGFNSLAIPRLATGVGALKWADVRPLIDKHLGSLNIPIMLYTEYHHSKVANEPL